MNRDFSLLIHSKKNVVFCIEQTSITNSEEALAMHKLLALLGNKGIRTTILPVHGSESLESVRKRLLDVAPADTLVITSLIPLVAFCTEHGISAFCISPDESISEAHAVFPDISSLYAVFNWALHVHRGAISDKLLLKPVHAVIAAAGKGTRLGFNKPKVLYPLADTTPLKIFYHKLQPVADNIIVMVSPEGASFIQEYVTREHLNVQIGVVHDSIGTADTVLHSEPFCTYASDILVVFGDQIGIPRQSVMELIRYHQMSAADLSFPTRLRKNPVIHLERDEHGIVQRVLRKRFHDRMPAYGENEAGIFVVKKALLYPTLLEMKKEHLELQKRQGIQTEKKEEFDFLDIIPVLSQKQYRVIAPSCELDEKTLGFNTVEETVLHVARIQEGADY